jgi:hypothetical protein
MLSVICFSKDRPLQLEGYIQSLLFYSSLPACALSILYADSPATSYKALVYKYPLINWVRESHFHSDLTRLVEAASDHILLGCDDVFFTDHFDTDFVLGYLTKEQDLFGFSLRLGLNVHLDSLPRLNVDGAVLQWEWGSAPDGHWSYPWDVSGSIYRRNFILTYLEDTPEVTNPNRFESFLANSCGDASRKIGSKLACFERSKCLILQVNRVQDEFLNEYDDSLKTNVAELYSAHTRGKQLDWPSFYQVINRVIHVDSRYFRLTDVIVEPTVVQSVLSSKSNDARATEILLRLRLFYWQYYSKLKQSLQRCIPLSVRTRLHNLLRSVQ